MDKIRNNFLIVELFIHFFKQTGAAQMKLGATV
jgi:hypothetical protein